MVNINQFAQTNVQGQVDLSFAGSVVSAVVADDEAIALVAGQAVALVDSATGVPQVTALSEDTDAPFGFVCRNVKDQDFPASARIELALQGTVMYMTAGDAIARGAKLEFDVSENEVIENAGTNPVVGYAYDAAAAAGDLIRVYILTPGFALPQTISDVAGLQDDLDDLGEFVQEKTVTATLAEINAGKVLIAGVATKSIIVTGFALRATGTFTTGTTIDLEDSNGTPVVVATFGQAALTTGALLLPTTSGVTLGAGFSVALTAGEDLVVTKTGSNFAGGTSISLSITYKIA